MKAFLLFKDHDFIVSEGRLNTKMLTSDLELGAIFKAIANDDNYVIETVKQALFSPLAKPEEIRYRQNVLKDCLANPNIVRDLYSIACNAIEKRREHYWGLTSQNVSFVLSSSVGLLKMFSDQLEKLHGIAENKSEFFHSNGFCSFFDMLTKELSEDYLAEIKMHLKELTFSDGMLISATLGETNTSTGFLLRRQKDIKHRWLKWRFAPSFSIAPRDDAGCDDLSTRRDFATLEMANTLLRAADHVLSFFEMLKKELSFYVGCLNLYDAINTLGLPICMPDSKPSDKRSFNCKGLYDISLALIKKHGIVGNDINADGKSLFFISGANQGGKTTFIRSVGQAQLMMQCGMFVGGESFVANIGDGIFTHFKKEEDPSMVSGKLDEELLRMSEIVDKLRADDIVLFNESFASTNELEGSEIGRQIVNALLEKNINMFFVTHMFDLTNGYYRMGDNKMMFLRAQRGADGQRTFRMEESPPLPTSFAQDVYSKIFGDL
jgi:hypothetical protein